MTHQGGEFSNSFEIGELLDIAGAIAERQLIDHEATQRLTAELTGRPVTQIPTEVRQKLATATAAMNISRLENPDAHLSFEESIDAAIEGSYGFLSDLFDNGSGTISEARLREAMINIGKTLSSEMGVTGEEISETFTKMFEVAKTIAGEEGVSVAEVYRDEEMYSGIFRRTYTPEEFANTALRGAEGFSEKTMNAVIVHMVNSVIPEEKREEIGEEEINAMFMEFQLDPEIQEQIKQAAETAQTVATHLAVANIIRFWGTETLQNLPEDIKKKLRITESSTALKLGGFALEGIGPEQADKLRMREAFVKNYFEERGWDINNASPEQIKEAESQPGWENPSL